MICAGFAAGRAPTVNTMALYARDAALISANVSVMAQSRPDLARAALEAVAAWAATGAIRPRIAAQFPFDQARHALDYVMNRRENGAVVVTLGSAS